MRKFVALVCGTIAFAPVTAASLPGQPPVPPAKPVTETIFGQKITDRYRYFEQQGPAVTNWMKAEGRFTRSYLDSLPQHADILQRLSAMTGSWDVIQSITPAAGGRTFYEQRSAGSDNFDLMVREANGQVRKLVDVAAIRAANGNEPFAINYFNPSNDGSKVGVGISEGGSEDASLWIYDAATGARIAGPIPNAQGAFPSWSPDDKTVFVSLLNPKKPGDPETAKYQFAKEYAWNLKDRPVPVLGAGVSSAIPFTADETPIIAIFPGSMVAVAGSINGVQNEIAMWTGSIADASRPDGHWQPLVNRADQITNISVSGNHIFLLSHKDAPTFKVLALDAGQPFSAAREIVPALADRVIEGLAAAADGLYVRARRGVYSELIRVPLNGGTEQIIPLPIKGSINELAADARYPGAKVILDSWATPPRSYAYDPTGGFADLGMGRAPQGFEPAQYQVVDLKAKAKDGVEVPLSFVTDKSAVHPRPVLLLAYGAYGISQFPTFGSRPMATLPNGIDYAVCHVRGGGELGEAWHLGGKDATKPNTWRDLIACGEELIGRSYATKERLFIIGGSAGGITMGRAMEERPDLFAGVFDLVPAANASRSEFSQTGPANIPEFGTIKDRQGFENLMAMDSLQNIKAGVKYPPIMITTGLNDPRVSSWEPAKFAATLRTAGPTEPVLFRVDEKAGHGIGSTKTQNDELYADVATFILSRTGAGAGTPQPAPGERGKR
ncbi:MAG TPA: prolyl oligopeptidase family serine peptidase [Sphingomicrobium sp.]|jgi:prolyl oligopeptidase|nr:prolyl oligopeptidase family serine peptidase [Sphingomicrobium sp.]HKU92645.1 prolyl oligopeptidase family serine peptidase [Sphingomicrobium sp.]